MVKIKKHCPKALLLMITGTIMGIIMGVMGLTVLVSYRMDTYHEKIKQLETIIEDKDIRFKKLEESMNKKKFILRGIEPVLIYEGDGLDKLTLEKSIKEKYSHLIGMEVRSIDIETVAQVIDKRIVKIKDRQFQLKVSKLMLTEELKIWADVKPVN